MTTLQSFLDWFDGFSENIETAPTPKQWERIKDRIKAIQAEAPVVAVAAPAPKQRRTNPETELAPTTAAWKSRFLARMLDRGIDPESGQDILKGITVDLGSLPEIVANKVADEAMGPVN